MRFGEKARINRLVCVYSNHKRSLCTHQQTDISKLPSTIIEWWAWLGSICLVNITGIFQTTKTFKTILSYLSSCRPQLMDIKYACVWVWIRKKKFNLLSLPWQPNKIFVSSKIILVCRKASTTPIKKNIVPNVCIGSLPAISYNSFQLGPKCFAKSSFSQSRPFFKVTPKMANEWILQKI